MVTSATASGDYEQLRATVTGVEVDQELPRVYHVLYVLEGLCCDILVGPVIPLSWGLGCSGSPSPPIYGHVILSHPITIEDERCPVHQPWVFFLHSQNCALVGNRQIDALVTRYALMQGPRRRADCAVR